MSARSKQMKVASNALLTEALAFYGDPCNWHSPSTGFAAQYDPESSPIQRDGGQRARLALQANTAPEQRDACSASILGAGLPTVTITNTVAVVDRAGVVHNVEVVIRASLDKGHVSDLTLISVSPAPEGVSDMMLLVAALGYSPNARQSLPDAAGKKLKGDAVEP